MEPGIARGNDDPGSPPGRIDYKHFIAQRLRLKKLKHGVSKKSKSKSRSKSGSKTRSRRSK